MLQELEREELRARARALERRREMMVDIQEARQAKERVKKEKTDVEARWQRIVEKEAKPKTLSRGLQPLEEKGRFKVEDRDVQLEVMRKAVEKVQAELIQVRATASEGPRWREQNEEADRPRQGRRGPDAVRKHKRSISGTFKIAVSICSIIF